MLLQTAISVLVLAQQIGGAPEGKVTFECVATPANAAIRQLGQSSGVAMYSAPSVANEMLILRFKDVPLKEAMDKIAEAATAEWVKTDTGLKLDRTPAILKALQTAEHDRRLRFLRKIIDKRTKEMPVFNDSTATLIRDQMAKPDMSGYGDGQMGAQAYQAAYAKASKADSQQPQNRFITRLVNALGIDAVADLPDGGRIVFSTTPTKMQKPLPPTTKDLLRTYATEQNLWHRIAAPESDDDDLRWQIRSGNDMWPYPSFQEVTGTPDQCMVIFQPDWGTESIRIEFRMANSRAESLAQGYSSVGEAPWPYQFARSVIVETDTAPASEEDAPQVKLSATADAMAKFAGSAYETTQKERSLPSEIAAFLVHPEKSEPLTLFPADPVLKGAAMKSLNIAVCVEDTCFLPDANLTAEQALAGEIAALDKRRGDGWLVAKPKQPLLTEHADRRALGQFFQAYLRDRRSTLEASGAYAFANPTGQACTLITKFSEMLAPRDSDLTWWQNSDWSFLRLYGSLDIGLRIKLGSGEPLFVSQMSASQRAILNEIVYGSYADRLTVESGDEGFVGDAPSSIFANEPTSFLANGLDPSTRLVATSDSRYVLFQTTKGEEGSENNEQEEALDQVAQELFEAMKPPEKRDPDSPAPPVVLGYKIGVRRTIHLSIKLALDHEAAADLTDVKRFDGPLVSIADLPGEIRLELAKRIEDLKKEQEEEDKDNIPPARTRL